MRNSGKTVKFEKFDARYEDHKPSVFKFGTFVNKYSDFDIEENDIPNEIISHEKGKNGDICFETEFPFSDEPVKLTRSAAKEICPGLVTDFYIKKLNEKNFFSDSQAKITTNISE